MRNIHPFSFSLLSGIFLSFPWIFPWGWPLLFFAFVPLFYAESCLKSYNRNLLLGLFYSSFLTWNLLATWWIAYVSFWGMLFIAISNALLMTLVWWTSNQIRSILGVVSGYFSLIVFWIAFEYISHRGLLPWPWLTLGNGFSNAIQIIQWYEFTGVLGGSGWILLINILLFELTKQIKHIHSLKFVVNTFVFFTIFLFPLSISAYMFFNYFETGEKRYAVVLQPNIDPYTEKFKGLSKKEQIQRLIQLTKQSISDSVDLIVAPETALPTLWEDSLITNNEVINSIKSTIKYYPKANFITGAITKRNNIPEPLKNTKYDSRNYNSALVINSLPEIQVYRKTILVAGVERAPFKESLNILPRFIIDPGGAIGELTPGEGPFILQMKSGEYVGPVICFESVFGNFVRQLALKGSSYLIVITNDGWWKHSSGVWQHFGYSRIRAIETRRSIVRSSNTGISGFINQKGEILSKSTMSQTCYLRSKIRMNNKVTFYAIYGDYLGEISIILSFTVILYGFVNRRKLNI